MLNALVSGLLALVAVATGAAGPGTSAADDPGEQVRQSATEVGSWRLDGRRLTWTSPQRLPVGNARPEFRLGARLLGYPRLSPNRRTLALRVSGTQPLPQGRLDGFPRLTVFLGGSQLDLQRAVVTQRSATPYVEPARGTPLAVDAGTLGPFETVTSNYRLRPVKLAGMQARVEMVGHVVRPEEAPPGRALVLFLHGRHDSCYRPDGKPVRFGTWPCPRGSQPVPSQLGYHYLQRLLASQGHVTVSIAANGINAQDFLLADGGAAARAALVDRHLRAWAGGRMLDITGVDMSRVLLVGHSRGGEGVNRAAIVASDSPYRIAGQLLVAPTSFGRQVAGYVPTITLLPYCDGDVADLQGQSYVDQARGLTQDDPSLRSAVLVMGANHNYFNTEWTPGTSAAPSFDDWGTFVGDPRDPVCGRRAASRLSPADQRAVGRAYVGGAARLLLDGDERLLAMFDGSDVEVASARGADVRSAAVGGHRTMRVLSARTQLSRPRWAKVSLCAGDADSLDSCAGRRLVFQKPHWQFWDHHRPPAAPALQMTWRREGALGGIHLRRALDLSDATSLDLRTAVDPKLGSVELAVRLYDGAGRVMQLIPASRGELQALPGVAPLGKLWAQTLRVPLPSRRGGVGPRIDLGDVRRISLVGLSDAGRVWVLDLAARRGGLARVPRRRLPWVSLSGTSQVEGSGDVTGQMSVPFTVRGRVRSPGEFVVLATNTTSPGEAARVVVPVVPGQASGVAAVPYRADDHDDVQVQRYVVRAYGLHNVATGRYASVARLIDDDPTPRLRVTRPARTVREGGAARWQVKIGRPVDYPVFVDARVGRRDDAGPLLQVADTHRWWRRQQWGNNQPPPSRTLAAARTGFFTFLGVGRSRARFTVPVRRDGALEGREEVTLEVLAGRLEATGTRTVYVLD